MMTQTPDELRKLADWSGRGGDSRARLLDKLKGTNLTFFSSFSNALSLFALQVCFCFRLLSPSAALKICFSSGWTRKPATACTTTYRPTS